MDRTRTRVSVAAAAGTALLAALGLAACEVSPDQINTWKGTQKGPDKLHDAVASSAQKPEIRGLAYAALVEIDQGASAEQALKEAPAAERPAVVHGAVQPLLRLVQAGGVDGDKRPQLNAKDALFGLRDAASVEDRAAIDDALVVWTTADLAGRMSAGGQGSEKILVAIGARGGMRLAQVLADPNASDRSRAEAARLLGKVGDPDTRAQAAAKLVVRAKAQEGTRDETLQQIGLVGGPPATAYLLSLAQDDKTAPSIRQKALFALSQGGDAGALAPALPTAIRIASDGKASGEVRDAAFELAEKIGPPAVPELVKLLDRSEDLLRWRAVEAALKAGRVAAITPVLEGLPQSRSYSKEDLHSYLVHDLELLGAPALPVLRDELKSRSWIARLGAAMAVGGLGKSDDAPLVEALGSDGTRLKGWAGAGTLGGEARAIAAALKARR